MVASRKWYCKCGFKHGRKDKFWAHLIALDKSEDRHWEVSRADWQAARNAEAKAKGNSPNQGQAKDYRSGGIRRTRYCKCGFTHSDELRFLEHLQLDNPVLALEDRHWPVPKEMWERAEAERALGLPW